MIQGVGRGVADRGRALPAAQLAPWAAEVARKEERARRVETARRVAEDVAGLVPLVVLIAIVLGALTGEFR